MLTDLNIANAQLRWDDTTLRFADKSSKFIDVLRMKCQELHSITLSDGKRVDR